MLSNYLAQLWGISLTLISLALLAKEKYLKRLFSAMQSESNLFCWALSSLVIGLAMVLSHNIWTNTWQVIITIFGWAALIKGLAVLFVPEFIMGWIKKMENATFIPLALIVSLFLGLVVTYLGFTA